MHTNIIAAQSTDMQCIIFFLNISNRESKRRLISIDTIVENFAGCQTRISGACMYHWISCTHLQEAVHGLGQEGCQNSSQHVIYSYSFVYSATRRVPSFLDAWLCYAHICTFLPLLSLPWPKPIDMALDRSMQPQGKVSVSHAETTMGDAQTALGNEESASYLLGFQTTHVKGVSRSSHLFFIIKATCRGCAWLGWDTQVCIRAIGTRDNSSKSVNKYAFDQEWSSLSTFTKTFTTTSNMFFPCPWVRQLQLDQGCMSKMFIFRQFSSENGSFLSLTGNNSLSTYISHWSYNVSSTVKRSISIACETNSLSTTVCSVCVGLA